MLRPFAPVPTPKQARALVELRAVFNAKPGREKRAVRKALKKYDKARKAA